MSSAKWWPFCTGLNVLTHKVSKCTNDGNKNAQNILCMKAVLKILISNQHSQSLAVAVEFSRDNLMLPKYNSFDAISSRICNNALQWSQITTRTSQFICLLTVLFISLCRLTSKERSKVHITGPLWRESQVTSEFSLKRTNNGEII